MSDSFKLDINIPQADIKSMAKEVIKEIIEEKIQEAMIDVDIKSIINGKLNGLDGKITKVLKTEVNKQIDTLIWSVRRETNSIIRETVLEEIQKKPLSGNIYLKISDSDVETDYDHNY